MNDYDPEKSSEYLLYQDANNLYGWAMSQRFPYLGFKWIDITSFFDIMNVFEDSETGYILKVDLKYSTCQS